MEDNSNYKSIQAVIKNLEQQLKSIEQVQLQQDFSMLRREIEEHFEQAIHALGARQQTLIGQLNSISQIQDSVFQGTTAQLKEKINKCKEMAQAGAFTYKHSIVSAEFVWQEALKLEDTPVDTSALLLRVTVDLPTELQANINCHGKVESCSNFATSKQKITTTTQSGSEEKILPNANISVASPAKTQEQLNTNLPKVEPAKKESPVPEAKAVEVRVAKAIITVGSTKGFANGIAAKAKFNNPLGICWNPNDNLLYVCDNSNSDIRKVSHAGSVAELHAHTDATFLKKFKPVRIVARDQNTFYVTSNEHTIFTVDSKGTATILAGSGEGYKDGVGTQARFSSPNGIAYNRRTGTIYIADSGNHKIRAVTPEGKVTTLAGSSEGYLNGSSNFAKFSTPLGICFDERNQSLLVCDSRNYKIRRVTLAGSVSTVCDMRYPTDITIADNIIFAISDLDVCRLQLTDDKYNEIILFQQTENVFQGIAVHVPSLSIFLTVSNHQIYKLFYELC